MTMYKLGVCFDVPMSVEIDGQCVHADVIDSYVDDDYLVYATSVEVNGEDVDVRIRLFANGYLMAEYGSSEVFYDDTPIYDCRSLVQEAVDAIEERIKEDRKKEVTQ